MIPLLRVTGLAALGSLVALRLAGAQDTLRLERGRTVERDLPAGGVHVYTLDLPPGRFVYGVADQLSVDVVVTVYGPAGSRLGEFDIPARGPEPFQFVTATAGNYRVEITPFEAEHGRYALTAHRIEPVANTPAGRVDQILAAYRGVGAPGGVVAVTQGGELRFARGYGLADLESGVPNTPRTVYHMASVSKQFTAFAILLLAAQGKLELDDDVRKFIPELYDFGRIVTLRHLLTHTSGLRDQWDLWMMSGGRMDDVIRQADLLRLITRQRELNFEPGTEYLYSNTGYTLAATVVERVTGRTFRDWMQEQVFTPLAMKATQIYDDHERLVPGRAYSYANAAQGGYRKAVLSYANAGATSLFTTAEDLAKWLRNFHTHQVGGVGVWEQLQERGVLARGDTLDYALGIAVTTHRGLRRIQHDGADAGYRTMLAYYPEIDAGVIVLANVASFAAGRVGTEVADAFFDDRMAPRPASQETAADRGVAVTTARLDACAGTYILDGGARVRVTRNGDQLVAQVEGEPPLALVALNDTLFRGRSVDATVSFHVEADGRVLQGALHRSASTAMRRVEPWNPAAAELATYAGRYYSAELETAYVVRADSSRLVAQHRRHGDIVLTPKDTDRFEGGAGYLRDVRFTRDAAGAINGMLVTTGRIRNLRFERQP
jgi:CubicO group peptidase (beta-lactamase class C family)